MPHYSYLIIKHSPLQRFFRCSQDCYGLQPCSLISADYLNILATYFDIFILVILSGI